MSKAGGERGMERNTLDPPYPGRRRDPDKPMYIAAHCAGQALPERFFLVS